jgi:hypothetical protein
MQGDSQWGENNEKLGFAVSFVHAAAKGSQESQQRKSAAHRFAATLTAPGCSEYSHFQTARPRWA